MAKNTGKTTCLNYVIRRLQEEDKKIALTSIGVDGEERDILYDTPKPRIVLHEDMVFVTSEQDFEQCEFPTEILSVSDRATALGRLITARAKGSGKVVLSGPSDSAWLHTTLMELPKYGVELTLVDGALSRMSLASPAVTDAMILCTGAACSPQLSELIRRTKFRCKLIELEQVDDGLQKKLQALENGIWVENPMNGEWEKIGNSVFTFKSAIIKQADVSTPLRSARHDDVKMGENGVNDFAALPQNHSLPILNKDAVIPSVAHEVCEVEESPCYKVTQTTSPRQRFFLSGAITDDFFKLLNAQKNHNTHLIITDFTKLFITPLTYDNFLRNGGKINVLQKAKLLAICTNPTSPEGTHLDPIELREQMQKALGVEVYDIMNQKKNR
ncbi:MAG: hypothetical protein FWE63_05285 [Bacteroidales bacterium]|nr:hypothetical protein [Bacteroidales bacterium]